MFKLFHIILAIVLSMVSGGATYIACIQDRFTMLGSLAMFWLSGIATFILIMGVYTIIEDNMENK